MSVRESLPAENITEAEEVIEKAGALIASVTGSKRIELLLALAMAKLRLAEVQMQGRRRL